MAIHVECPGCRCQYRMEAHDAGTQRQCQACGTVFEVPTDVPFDSMQVYPARAVTPPPQPGAGGAAPQPYGGYAYPPPSTTGVTVVAVLNIVEGALFVIWAAISVIIAVVAAEGLIPEQDMQELEAELLTSMFTIAAVFSVISAALQVWAGIALLRRSRGARHLGVAAGILGCAGIWGCYCFPIGLGVGITTLVILFGSNARLVLDGPESY